MDKSLVSLKTEWDNDEIGRGKIEYEVILPNRAADSNYSSALAEIEQELEKCRIKTDELNEDVERLTNRADRVDYAVAVASGVLCGMIDSFLVGEMELDRDKVQKMLEKKYHTANDNAYEHTDQDGHWISSSLYHRLDDLAHHPTVLGLTAAILARYFRLVLYLDGSDGKPHVFFADRAENEATRKLEKGQLVKAWCGAMIGGICIWLSNAAKKKYAEATGTECPEGLKAILQTIGRTPAILEVLKAADTWVGHMMSDVSTAQGIPGVFLSLLKEISVLPGLRNTNLPVFADGLYRKGGFNLSRYGGVAFANLKKQAMPVLINEILVRSFYFIRRTASEYRERGGWQQIDWNAVVPFENATVARMMTVACGTFTAVDLADAVIRSGGFNAACLLRVNFVGIGRFAVAIGTEIEMRTKREKLINERTAIYAEMLSLTQAKLYYRQADLWLTHRDMYEKEAQLWQAVRSTGEALQKTYAAAGKATEYFAESWDAAAEGIAQASANRDGIEQLNPGMLEEISGRRTRSGSGFPQLRKREGQHNGNSEA